MYETEIRFVAKGTAQASFTLADETQEAQCHCAFKARVATTSVLWTLFCIEVPGKDSKQLNLT